AFGDLERLCVDEDTLVAGEFADHVFRFLLRDRDLRCGNRYSRYSTAQDQQSAPGRQHEDLLSIAGEVPVRVKFESNHVTTAISEWRRVGGDPSATTICHL